MIPCKFDIAKSIFIDNISQIQLTYDTAGAVDSNYKSKTPAQTMKDEFGFCTEQVELAELLLKQEKVIPLEKYQLFAVPHNNIYDVKIDLSHAFIGIPDENNWILFETGFRARNRGGVRCFANRGDGLNYVLKLYSQSLTIAHITNLLLTIYKYDFPAENKAFQAFAKEVMIERNRVFVGRQ